MKRLCLRCDDTGWVCVASYIANIRMQIAPIAKVSEAASDSTYAQSIGAVGNWLGPTPHLICIKQ